MTVVLDISSRSAIRECGTPSAAKRRISAQSSNVITLQSWVFSFHRRNCPVFKRRRQMTFTIAQLLRFGERSDSRDYFRCKEFKSALLELEGKSRKEQARDVVEVVHHQTLVRVNSLRHFIGRSPED